MSELLATLFSPALLFALLLYSLLVIALEWLTARLQHAVHEVTLTAWLLEHVGLPWARVIALLVFVFLAYPALFGLREAPPLGSLLSAHDGRVSTLINTAFVLSLLLPLLPVAGNWKSIVLPLQAIAVSSLLFHWLTLSLGRADVHYWPGWGIALAIIVLAPSTQWLAQHGSHYFGAYIDRLSEREGFDALLYEGLLLLMQVPAILLYTLSLGQQLR